MDQITIRKDSISKSDVRTVISWFYDSLLDLYKDYDDPEFWAADYIDNEVPRMY